MKIVKLKNKNWEIIREHAKSCFPEECTGIFECKKINNKEITITNIFVCKNVSKTKKYESMISKRDMKKLRPVMASGIKKGLVYGVYHSHPNTGTLELSDQDMFWAKFRKRFQLQIIVGIKKTKDILRTRRIFWQFSNSRWSEWAFRSLR